MRAASLVDRISELDELISSGWSDVPGTAIPGDWKRVTAPVMPPEAARPAKPKPMRRSAASNPRRVSVVNVGKFKTLCPRKKNRVAAIAEAMTELDVHTRLLKLSKAKLIPRLFVDGGQVRFETHDGRMVTVGARAAAQIAVSERLPDHLL